MPVGGLTMFESIAAFVHDNALWIGACMLIMAVTLFVNQWYAERAMRRMLEDGTDGDEYETLTVRLD